MWLAGTSPKQQPRSNRQTGACAFAERSDVTNIIKKPLFRSVQKGSLSKKFKSEKVSPSEHDWSAAQPTDLLRYLPYQP
jgi:hypothetical protein